jgi:glucose-1-phosphate cytidylyltransferase
VLVKAVILAGGLGTRISEETQVKPKPMIEIGGKPILWHVMKIYSSHGINDFIVCLGYKGYLIKEYFANYFLHTCDVSFDIANNSMEVHETTAEPWRVTLVNTGDATMTGGRIKRISKYLADEETFCLTYGDGLGDVDIAASIELHRRERVLATVTAVQPPGRFGALELEDERILDFREKPIGDGGWVNGGFFVLQREVLDYIAGDDTAWEQAPLNQLAQERQLAVYRHTGFWHPMDTQRDMRLLEQLWASAEAPWKSW